MADKEPNELAGQDKEPSLEKDELFGGSLEPSEGDKEAGKESPQGEPKKEEGGVTGKSTGQDEDSDPELKGIFDDLEKDIPEALKTHAGNVKKKLQGYFTKKNQTISTELEGLRKNQITENLKKDYSQLYGWYEKIQRNPKEGLRELASSFGVSVAELVSASEAIKPKQEELAPDQLVTAEDYANFTRQEVRKAVEELRDKEVRPLKDFLAESKKTAVERENVQRGADLVKDAMATLPGFIDDSKKDAKDWKDRLSLEGKQAMAAVYNGEFIGPNALRNAYKAIQADKLSIKVREAEELLKRKDTEFGDFKKNLAGADNPPGGTKQTTIAPSSPDKFWDDLSGESLS